MRAKQFVIELLSGDKELKRKVKSISSAWHDMKKGYPQITVTQIYSRAASFSDNRVDMRVPLIQIDIWNKGNPFLISEMVTRILAENGYDYSDEREQNEVEINRVILEYRIEE